MAQFGPGSPSVPSYQFKIQPRVNLDYEIEYKKGDLFESTDAGLVHCVSADFRMGAGIAKTFMQKYPELKELRAQKSDKTGFVAAVPISDMPSKRYIYNLVTKQKYNDRPKIVDLEKSLKDLRVKCTEHGVTRLSMPVIGCGLDKLNWPEEVEVALKKTFSDSKIAITVYYINKHPLAKEAEIVTRPAPDEHVAAEAEVDYEIQYTSGDLFNSTDAGLVHCVSADFRMGGGIAKIFVKKYPKLKELMRQTSDKVGYVVPVTVQQLAPKQGIPSKRYIYNLVTKLRVRYRPKYSDLENSLKDLRVACTQHKVTRLSMPVIGCGLDKMKWPIVQKIIKNTFAGSGITITVYYMGKNPPSES